MQIYWVALQEAIKRTALLGYETETLAKTSGPILTEENGFAFITAFEKAIGYSGLKLDDLPFRCAEISWRAKPILEEITQTKAALTLGAVAKGDSILWSADATSLQELRSSGNYHVWLSLASGEIVDLTLLPSILLQTQQDLSRAQPLAGQPDHLAFRWIPKLVGDEPIRELLRNGSL